MYLKPGTGYYELGAGRRTSIPDEEIVERVIISENSRGDLFEDIYNQLDKYAE